MVVPVKDAQLYKSLVRVLQHVTITRPELAYSVNKVFQSMQKPTNGHWKDVKRILRYLRVTMDYGIHLKKTAKLSLVWFYDTNKSSNPDN